MVSTCSLGPFHQCLVVIFLMLKSDFVILFNNFYFYFYLFMAVLGLRFYVRAFSSCGNRGPLFIAVRGPLTVAGSLVVEHRLQMRRLSNCGSRAQLLCGMWDLPRPGHEPVSPALAGRFSTTAPSGKPWFCNSYACITLEVSELSKFLCIEDKTLYDLTLLSSFFSWTLILPTDVLNVHHT